MATIVDVNPAALRAAIHALYYIALQKARQSPELSADLTDEYHHARHLEEVMRNNGL